MRRNVKRHLMRFFSTLNRNSNIPILRRPPNTRPRQRLLIEKFHQQLMKRHRSSHLLIKMTVRLRTATLLRMKVVTLTRTPTNFLTIRRQPTRTTFNIVAVRQHRIVAITPTRLNMLFRRTFLRMRPRVLNFIILGNQIRLLSQRLISITILRRRLMRNLTFML